MLQNLPKIVLHKFLFNIEFLEDSLLPEFKGSTFRGALGWHLRKAVNDFTALYEHIFETKGDENNPKVLLGVDDIPRPYILHPPLIKKRSFKKGEVVTVGISLIGYAHNFLESFIKAFISMGKTGITSKKHKFKLLNVFNEDCFGSKYNIYEAGSTTFKNNYKAITQKEILKNINYLTTKIKLEFESPFELRDDSQTIKAEDKHKITPVLLVNLLESRYRNLAQLFCRVKFEDNPIFKPDSSVVISKLDVNDYKMPRHRTKDDKDEEFEGLTGCIYIEGNLKSIIPLLHIGEKINIGNKTSFGWGQYRIILLD